MVFIMEPKNPTKKRQVVCTNCGHRFRSRIKDPICSKCFSRNIENLKDIPNTIVRKDLKRIKELNKELTKELKESKEFNIRMFKKLIVRIESLETAQ